MENKVKTRNEMNKLQQHKQIRQMEVSHKLEELLHKRDVLLKDIKMFSTLFKKLRIPFKQDNNNILSSRIRLQWSLYKGCTNYKKLMNLFNQLRYDGYFTIIKPNYYEIHNYDLLTFYLNKVKLLKKYCFLIRMLTKDNIVDVLDNNKIEYKDIDNVDKYLLVKV